MTHMGDFLADRYVVGDCTHCGKDAKGDECDACGPFDDAIELKNPRCNLGRMWLFTCHTGHEAFVFQAGQVAAAGGRLLR